jgi:exopolyphosphatase / guanosine-5'-triphosphate,3'-diphosphate pyrophosphatase
MRLAIIDMGTNTFHLMIADFGQSGYQILWNEKTPVRIGVGGINKKTITDEAFDRAIATLKKMKSKADELEVQSIYAFGTSALRNADNKNSVVEKIRNETGIQTKIISGNEEAEYIYHGVNLALKLKQENVLIVDIGGGSVEFIIGNGSSIVWKESFEIGGQRLLERFQKHDPILPSEIDDVTSHLKESLSSLADVMKIHSPKILAGSSGTFDTLSEIYCLQLGIEYSEEPETPFDKEAFQKIYHDIISKNRAERMQIPGMIELRVDMIVVACVLVKFILDSFQFHQIRVSSYSLKEGVLATLLKS